MVREADRPAKSRDLLLSNAQSPPTLFLHPHFGVLILLLADHARCNHDQ